MSLSRRLGIFVAFALLALLILAPSEARVRAGAGEPPPNDDFADATVIGELPFSDAINTTGATAEPAEVTSSCVPGGSSEPAIESTVWYRYEVESEIILQVDGIGSDFAPIINAFVETPQGVQMISCVGPFSNEDIHLVLHAEADTAYLFQVGGSRLLGDPGGELVFHMNVLTSPANDDFTNAEPLGQLPASRALSVILGTSEEHEPVPCGREGIVEIGTSVWYRLDASDSDFIRIEALTASGAPPFVVSVYRGESFETLEEIACGFTHAKLTRMGFVPPVGEIVYLQVSTRRSAIFAEDFGNYLELQLDVYPVVLPMCSMPTASFADAVEDVSGIFTPLMFGGDHDVRSIGVSSSGSHTCLEIMFARPIPAPDWRTSTPLIEIDIDTDSSALTGFRSDLCGGGDALGVETTLALAGRSGLLFHPFLGPPPEGSVDYLSAAALFDDNVMTAIIPNELVGGDDQFRFAIQVNGPRGRDCAPDRGFFQVPPPAFGDANCDGQVDSRDAVVILQFFARLTTSLLCESVADANGNGTIGSIDAALILQLDAGLIDGLPGAP